MPKGPSLCRQCRKRASEQNSEICFHCRVASVGFTFRAAGYGRKAFNESTIAEKRAEILGDKVVGVDVVPASDFGG